MKILFINNLFGEFARGGAEQVVKTMAEEYHCAGHHVSVVTTAPTRQQPKVVDSIKLYYLNNFISRNFNRLNRLPVVVRLFWHLANLFNVAGYLELKKILDREEPDLIWTHNMMGVGMLGYCAIRKSKKNHYHTLHDIQLLHPSGLLIYGKEEVIFCPLTKLHYFITRRLIGSPHKVFSPSSWLLKEHLSRHFFKHSSASVLANPVEQSRADTVETNRSYKVRFLCVGQLEDHKGAEFLIQAFSELNTGKAELLLVGGGSQYEKLKKISDGHYNIKLLGKKTHEEVERLMRSADCFIQPSKCYENSPTVIIEALSFGLPVIASSLGGTPELLKNDQRFLFKPMDQGELIDRINWFLNNQLTAKQFAAERSRELRSQNVKQVLLELIGK